MRYTYKNITKTSQLLTLASQQRNSVAHIPLGAGSVIELSYPGLDLYIPHILARIDEGGNDITHIVLRDQATAKAAPTISTPVVPPAVSPKQVVESPNPTAVKPGIYVDNTPKIKPVEQVTPAQVAPVLEIKPEQAVKIETPAEEAAAKDTKSK